jgi:hypothetical protein
MVLLVIGLVALLVVVVGVVTVIALARRQEQEAGDKAPVSLPSDFVAPVSSGGYHWRHEDETPEEFHKRIARENAEAAAAAAKK